MLESRNFGFFLTCFIDSFLGHCIILITVIQWIKKLKQRAIRGTLYKNYRAKNLPSHILLHFVGLEA